MNFNGVKRFSIIGALSVCVMFTTYSGWLFSLSRAPDELLSTLYQFVLTSLLATWLVADAQEFRRARPSFDEGWFIIAVFPFYVPYYLISTRRWRRGALIIIGIVLLFMLPWLGQLAWLVEVFIWILRRILGLVARLLWFAKFILSHAG
jgi:hypothetical protein